MGRHKLGLGDEARLVLALLVLLNSLGELESLVITNKMRYSMGNSQDSRIQVPWDQMVGLVDASSDLFKQEGSTIYKFQDRRRPHYKQNKAVRLLDDEDRSLLEKFYRETKEGDPFLDDKVTTESLWTDKENSLSLKDPSGWTIDPQLVADQLATAHYSPSLKLLTSYNPVVESAEIFGGDRPKAGGIVGATFYGQDSQTKPGVSSKVALDAIKLHDSMLRQPPRDGKVRVRMYHHRAIHDEPRLYGSGPWKYWGHGWGMEFGFDPRSQTEGKDFYQKGYTIERAFGRDFCHQPGVHCRPPDPHFFKDPLDVGKYSVEEYGRPATKSFEPAE